MIKNRGNAKRGFKLEEEEEPPAVDAEDKEPPAVDEESSDEDAAENAEQLKAEQEKLRLFVAKFVEKTKEDVK